MIYAMAFCPSLEYSGYAENITLGADNYISHTALRVGGTGALTAQTLAQLETPVTMLGFAAGYSGGEIETALRRQSVNTDLVYLEEGMSPINFALNHGMETRFYYTDPIISFDNLTILLDKIAALSADDILLLSGGIPESVPKDIYEHIPDLICGTRVVLDIPAEPAVKCLKFSPFLMVASGEFLTEAFGESPQNEADVFEYISRFCEMGAQNVLAFSEGKSAFLLSADGTRRRCELPPFSGDPRIARSALIAGFLAGCVDKDVDFDYAMMLASAALRAACAANGIPSKPKIIEIMKTLLKNYTTN